MVQLQNHEEKQIDIGEIQTVSDKKAWMGFKAVCPQTFTCKMPAKLSTQQPDASLPIYLIDL